MFNFSNFRKKRFLVVIAIAVVVASTSLIARSNSSTEIKSLPKITAKVVESQIQSSVSSSLEETNVPSSQSSEPISSEVSAAESEAPSSKTQEVKSEKSSKTVSSQTKPKTEEKNTANTSSTSPQPEPQPTPQLAVEKIKGVSNSQQVIVVSTNGYSSINAKVELYQKDGSWKKIDSFSGVVGLNGITFDKKEGDKKAPAGIFSLGIAFGKLDNPGTRLSYKKVNENDVWVDDPSSQFYNTLQQGPANGRWNSAENLLRSDFLYDYAINIESNPSCTPGKGSAIFLHVWRGSGSGTYGCTAIPKDKLVFILQWLEPSKNPLIVQAPENALDQM